MNFGKMANQCHNKVLDLTPGSIAALRGIPFAGAVQHGRYMPKELKWFS
jgi:hypothetical protein